MRSVKLCRAMHVVRDDTDVRIIERGELVGSCRGGQRGVKRPTSSDANLASFCMSCRPLHDRESAPVQESVTSRSFSNAKGTNTAFCPRCGHR